jgi:hypothetical protein
VHGAHLAVNALAGGADRLELALEEEERTGNAH